MNETWWVDIGSLDKSQTAVLSEQPETEMLVAGPPGSGKTNILMLRANYVKSVFPRIAFLTFTRTLAEFLRSSPNIGRADQIQKADIKTFMGWAKQIIKERGHDVPDENGEFDEVREVIAKKLNSVIEEQNLGKFFDVIFVDEVQDFLKEELIAIRKLTHHINAAGDSRQRIFRNREGIPTVKGMVGKSITLEKHYRIGEKICRLADQILPPESDSVTLLEGCNYPEDKRESSVKAVSFKEPKEVYADCIQTIKEQIRYIPDEPIGVLSPTTDVLDEFWDALIADGELAGIAIRQKASEYQAFGPKSQIRVMTIASAKGSEFRAVHILNSERFTTKNRELAFTAVTRAKTEVVLYHIGRLAGHVVPPSDKLPALAKIF
jgi:superfamily I DNA and RNA helicase